jgi:hypothetical protein
MVNSVFIDFEDVAAQNEPVKVGHFRCAECLGEFACVRHKYDEKLPNGGMLPLYKMRIVPSRKIPVADELCANCGSKKT